VTLRSYRYAWAERAKVAGMPERFAQEALGHNSKAVHRAYAKRALMKIPSLEDYEQRATQRHEGRRHRLLSRTTVDRHPPLRARLDCKRVNSSAPKRSNDCLLYYRERTR
jgi:hypothetical protein